MSYINHTAIIGPNVIIEDNVYIGAFCVIGSHAEYRSKVSERNDQPGVVVIRSGTTIREFVTIHGSASPDGETYIGPNCYIQAHAHIGHDASLEGNNTIACQAIVAGHVDLREYASMGLAAVTHQHAVMMPGSFLGANCFFKGIAEPFTIYAGVPAKPIGLNKRLGEDLCAQGHTLADTYLRVAQSAHTPIGSHPSSHQQHTPHEHPPLSPCDPSQ